MYKCNLLSWCHGVVFGTKTGYGVCLLCNTASQKRTQLHLHELIYRRDVAESVLISKNKKNKKTYKREVPSTQHVIWSLLQSSQFSVELAKEQVVTTCSQDLGEGVKKNRRIPENHKTQQQYHTHCSGLKKKKKKKKKNNTKSHSSSLQKSWPKGHCYLECKIQPNKKLQCHSELIRCTACMIGQEMLKNTMWISDRTIVTRRQLLSKSS